MHHCCGNKMLLQEEIELQAVQRILLYDRRLQPAEKYCVKIVVIFFIVHMIIVFISKHNV